MQSGILKEEKSGLLYYTGYSYKMLYDWDQYFEALIQIYSGFSSSYIKNGALIFLDNMREDGFIPRHVPIGNGPWEEEHAKPFFCQIALLVIEHYKEYDWILNEKRMNQCEKYIQYWLHQMDSDSNGLSEWRSAPHSGMDNQHERVGYWGDRFCEGVDLNCYLVVEMRAFAKLCKMFNDEKRAAQYNHYAQEKADLINSIMWDQDDAFYYDRNWKWNKGENICKSQLSDSVLNLRSALEKIKVKTVSGFMPMWAGIASKEQVSLLVSKHLLNEEEFWGDYPVTTQAKNEMFYTPQVLPTDLGCCWRANTWIPTNFMIVRGLLNYSYHDIAQTIVDRTMKMIKKSGIREYYNAINGDGCGLDPFYGWSLLAYFFQYDKDMYMQKADNQTADEK